jgi:hypothetical protein
VILKKGLNCTLDIWLKTLIQELKGGLPPEKKLLVYEQKDVQSAGEKGVQPLILV